MSVEQQVLARVTRLLADLGVPYMVTGSLASSVHGKPRTTHDADIVIDPTPPALDRLVAELQAGGFFVDGAVAREALRTRRQFNAISTASAFKVERRIRAAAHRCRGNPGRQGDIVGPPLHRALGARAGRARPLAGDRG